MFGFSDALKRTYVTQEIVVKGGLKSSNSLSSSSNQACIVYDWGTLVMGILYIGCTTIALIPIARVKRTYLTLGVTHWHAIGQIYGLMSRWHKQRATRSFKCRINFHNLFNFSHQHNYYTKKRYIYYIRHHRTKTQTRDHFSLPHNSNLNNFYQPLALVD